MLESVANVISRVEEIKSHFKSARAGGTVTIAPHTTASPLKQGNNVQAFFPSYLIEQAKECADECASSLPSKGVTNYDDMIETAAAKYGLDPALVKAVVQAESGFNANAVSSVGAQGLMQLMPSTASSLGCSNPFDPAANIEAGTKYLKTQIERFGSVDKALAAYNAGPGAVMKYGGIPPFKETQNYVRKVLSYRENFSSGS